MNLPIITKEGQDTGRTITLAEDVFGVIPHSYIIYLCVVNRRNNERQGTAGTKEKSKITSSTRKILKQKGAGHARKGSRKSGILRGGGRIFGAQPRNYASKINKAESRYGRKSALAIKARNNQIIVIEDFVLQDPSTKQYVELLNQLSLGQEKVLWVTAKVEENLILSLRNVQRNKIITVHQLNTYDLLDATRVLFFEKALPLVQQKFA